MIRKMLNTVERFIDSLWEVSVPAGVTLVSLALASAMWLLVYIIVSLPWIFILPLLVGAVWFVDKCLVAIREM